MTADVPAPAETPDPGGWQPVRRAGATVRAGELLRLVGALVLLIALVLQWYGTVGVGGLERAGASGAVGAWTTMPVARWLMVATVVIGIVSAALGIGGRRWAGRPAGAATTAAAVLGVLTTLAVGYRVLIDPPLPDRIIDVKLGALVGLGGSLAVALGALDSWRRAQEGRRFAGGEPVQAAGRGGTLTPAR